MNILSESLSSFIATLLQFTSAFLPKLIFGFLIIFIGLIVASLLKDLIKLVFKYFRIERWLEVAGVIKSQDVSVWPNLLGELVRWITILIFLMSSVEVWGIPKVADVLQQLLNFLPNVLVVVVIGWIGLVAGKFAHDIVRHGVRGLGSHESLVLGNAARYTLIFFTVIIILTQLGIASDLLKILFTGIVSMLALALGLAFGLGGQEEARIIIKKLLQRFESSQEKPRQK